MNCCHCKKYKNIYEKRVSHKKRQKTVGKKKNVDIKCICLKMHLMSLETFDATNHIRALRTFGWKNNFLLLLFSNVEFEAFVLNKNLQMYCFS